MAYVFKDLPNQNAPATLASAIPSGATTIVLTTGTGTLLPSPTGGDLAACRIEQELITYTTRTTDTLTGVTRGIGGTTAVAHSAGKQVRNTAPADFFNNVGGGGIPDTLVGAGGTVSTDGSGAFGSKIYLQTGGAGPILIDSKLIDEYGGGITFKSSVRVATTTNGTLSTAFANGQTVDGVVLATGDRILLKDQSTGSQNGLYVVQASGSPTRSTDANAASEVFQGFCVFVREGTVNANRLYLHTTTGAITLGTTALTFAQVGAGVSDHALLSNVTANQHHTEDHDHDGSPTQKLAQANTHETPDTDSATTALHHTLGTGANQAAAGNDSRLSNARTPTAHETTHRSAGSDPLSHANLAALTTGDPHTQYQQESEKGAASGYASLDGSTLVPKAQLGTGTADNTTYLRGDGTWNTPSAGASTSFAGARVYNSGSISVSSGGSGTTLTFDTERYDTDAFHSTSSNTSRLTVPSGKGGKYHMEGHAQFASGTTGERELRVLLNGTTIIAANTEQGLIAENVTVHVSTDYELAVGDYVELVAFQDGIGSLNVVAVGNYSPEFSCSLWGGSGSAGLYSAYLCYQDQKSAGTAGGTFTSGAWRTHDLNTEVADTGGNGSVASNQITLAAGTYRVFACADGSYCGVHRVRLYNVTDSAILVEGQNTASSAQDTGVTETHALLMGRFTIAGTKTIELQHKCETTRATSGFGIAANATLGVTNEMYASVELEKEA